MTFASIKYIVVIISIGFANVANELKSQIRIVESIRGADVKSNSGLFFHGAIRCFQIKIQYKKDLTVLVLSVSNTKL